MPLLLLVGLLAAAPAPAALLRRASVELGCPTGKLKVASREAADGPIPAKATVGGCGKEVRLYLDKSGWVTAEEMLTITDVGTVVDLVNLGLPMGDARFEAASVEAACLFPKILQGLGFVQIRFKPKRDPALDAWLERLTGRLKGVPPADLKWTDRIPGCQRVDRVADAGADAVPVVHYVIDPRDESEGNHGSTTGVTLLEGGGVIFWQEEW